MSKILVVDDNATNRKVLVTWLNAEGYLTVDAADGSDGLATARREQPNLVISDILMPTMDGYEFIRRLRLEPGFAETAVMFYTAGYHEREARELATKCGVWRVLIKPCARVEFIAAVAEALARSSAMPQATPPDKQEFDIDHLRLLTDKLSQKADELSSVNARLAALTELNVKLASERDPRELLQQVCSGARDLLGARYSVLAVEQKVPAQPPLCFCSGLDFGGARAAELSLTDGGLLANVFRERRLRRLEARNGAPIDTGLPGAYPPARAVLAVPVSSITRIYGCLCVADKVGVEAFSPHDEQLLAILGAQVGRVYENGALYQELEKRATQILQLNRVYAMLSSINALIVRVSDRGHLLREACRIAVEQGGFRGAWCGLIEALSQVGQAAAAGEFLLGGPAGPTDALDIGAHPFVTAAITSKQPAVANDLARAGLTDTLTETLLARGSKALAALPLVVGGQGVGCLVLLSAEPRVFDGAEMRLLEELGGDISFALDHIDKAERLNYLAYYDSLTGLANRTFLQERLAQHIRGLGEHQSPFALVIFDVQDFDSLNDTLGRSAADDVLRELAERLVSLAGHAGYVARLGSDDFAVVVPQPQKTLDVTRAVEGLLAQSPSEVFEVGGQRLALRLQAGIALFPDDGLDGASLLRSAEAALKNAKATRAPYAFYTQQLGRALQEKHALERSLRTAFEKRELELHYQPTVDLKARRLVGAEALMRWRHPQRGLILPATFIPLMEETGLIVEGGVWALRQASADHARWVAEGLTAPRIAVNVSSVQLRREDFVRTVAEALSAGGSNDGIDIEVTESLLMQNVADNIEKLTQIRELGVGIALDDFGTGYSSLAYLAKLPVQAIKIDRSFVAAMLDDPSAMTLVSTVISLAHTLRLKTVAEGVESEEQAKILRLLHCDQMQGYLVSQPLSFEAMTAFIRQQPASSG